MNVYLIKVLVDNVAHITERVCLTEKIALREWIKLQKKNKNNTYKIDKEKVIMR